MTTDKTAPTAPAPADPPAAPARTVGDKVGFTVKGERILGTVIAPGKDDNHYIVQHHGQETELVASRLKDPSDPTE